MDGKYVFAGNRAFVLERMMQLGLNVNRIWVVKDSYLQRYLEQHEIEHFLIEDKMTFLKEIAEEKFDYFVSNGLPVIIPADILGDTEKKFINIHPSLLPDLRGKDPVPGAILYRRDSGATCHLMNAQIDGGDIIAQIKIDYSEDLEAGLLYQLSFRAEADVFELAYKRNFLPESRQMERGEEIYYSFKEEDLWIDIEKDSCEEIISKVRAFSTRNKGAIIQIDGKIYKCWDVRIIENNYLREYCKNDDFAQIVLKYENKMIMSKGNSFLLMTVEEEV